MKENALLWKQKSCRKMFHASVLNFCFMPSINVPYDQKKHPLVKVAVAFLYVFSSLSRQFLVSYSVFELSAAKMYAFTPL